MSDEREDLWSYGVTADDSRGSWPPPEPDEDPDADDPIRHHTGRFMSPSLGAYDPSAAHEALSDRNGADDEYFRDFGYGQGFGDGRLAAGYDSGLASARRPAWADPSGPSRSRPDPFPEVGLRNSELAGTAEPRWHDDRTVSFGPGGPQVPHDPRAPSPPEFGLQDELDDLRPEPDDDTDGGGGRRNAIEWVVVLVGAVLLALVLRYLVIQAFWIPSPSMETTLLVRDRVLVNKVSYRLHDINRGDIVVFRRTDAEVEQNPELPRDVIKRVIALGGETIEITDNEVFIDGLLLQEPYLDEGVVTSDFGPETVPEGHVFVMGDNRELSLDSRFETGPVAEDRVVGRAFFLFWPLDRLGAL